MPLAIFQIVGVVAMTLFLSLAAYSLYSKLLTDWAIPGWTSHVLVGSFFGALNALGISILGEYVIRIYDQVRARPLYLVDRTVNIAGESEGANHAAGDRPYVELLEEVESLVQAASPSADDSSAPPVLLPIRPNEIESPGA